MPNCPRIMLAVPVLRRAKYEADPLFLAGEKDNWAVWQLTLLLFYQSTKRLKEKLSQCMTRSIYVYKSCPFYQTCVRSSLWDSRRGWIVWRDPAYLPLFSLFEKGYMLGQIKFSKCHYLPLLCDRMCQNNREFGCHMKRVFWGFPGILMQISHKYCLAGSLWSRVPVYIIYNAQWGCSGWNFGH